MVLVFNIWMDEMNDVESSMEKLVLSYLLRAEPGLLVWLTTLDA